MKIIREAFWGLCDRTVSVLGMLRPRQLHLMGNEAPTLVLANASFEQNIARWAVIIINPASDFARVYHGVVPEALVSFWQVGDKEQIICEAESFAALLARHEVSNRFCKRKAVFGIDNEASFLNQYRARAPPFFRKRWGASLD